MKNKRYHTFGTDPKSATPIEIFFGHSD